MSGPDDGLVLTLKTPKQGQAYTFGRRDECDVVLPYDTQISRRHASLFQRDGKWYLKDLESRNGTYLGQQKIDDATGILPGQMFRIGRTWLRVQQDSTESKD